MEFDLVSSFQPTGDQPAAIQQLVEGIQRGDRAQVLLGVTGSGKTFSIANVIQQVKKPALVLSHNKTLAAQLYNEFKQFFPENAVEYFVSYYDYYQPEAYVPTTNTYIEKDLSINDEIEKLRLSTTTSLLSARRDVIVVSSVSCLYGIGNPSDFKENIIKFNVGQRISLRNAMQTLVNSLYSRNDMEFRRGNFRLRGDTLDVFLAYADIAYRLIFFGDEIESIESIYPDNGQTIEGLSDVIIFPASIFVTSQEQINDAIREIQLDLGTQIEYFKETGRHLEAKRLEDRVTYDVEMMKELGYCSGIENYSRYFDHREVGERPFCLFDYFPEDMLLIIDESHATIPQIKAMYGGDRARKINLVDYGFRLPAALDNRPLKFEEFQALSNQVIYVSATPAEFEIEEAEGVVVEQVIRPTGLLDPIIEVKPSVNQVDDLLDEIEKVVARNERILVTTLTKKMAEELSKYMLKLDIRCRYIHSDVETLDRVQILHDLRLGVFDVLIGVNLLREGLDLPEVALVAILDADKEGFLRSERALTQTAGRAARNVNSKVIMYADKITNSMQHTIDETNRRREKQIAYNKIHNITPTQIKKHLEDSLVKRNDPTKNYDNDYMSQPIAADPVVQYMSQEQIRKAYLAAKKKMEAAVKELDFNQAALYRDEMLDWKRKIDN